MWTSGDLAGVWRLVREESVAPDGSLSLPYGENRQGQLIYSTTGYMVVVATPIERSRFSGSRMDLNGAPASEQAEAARDCVCYAGTYEVLGEYVEHRIWSALNPSVTGLTRRRRIELQGERLTLITMKNEDGSHGRITWTRVASS